MRNSTPNSSYANNTNLTARLAEFSDLASQQIGNKLGYPTANIIPDDRNLLIPGNGVYCVESVINDKRFVGICNIGFRPTVDINNKNIII